MRNPDRIEKVMRELTELWKKRPDWRLGQLIFNIPGRDPFFIEDYDMITLGYEKFGDGDKPNTEDFPEYYTNSVTQNSENFCEGMYDGVLKAVKEYKESGYDFNYTLPRTKKMERCWGFGMSCATDDDFCPHDEVEECMKRNKL